MKPKLNKKKKTEEFHLWINQLKLERRNDYIRKVEVKE